MQDSADTTIITKPPKHPKKSKKHKKERTNEKRKRRDESSGSTNDSEPSTARDDNDNVADRSITKQPPKHPKKSKKHKKERSNIKKKRRDESSSTNGSEATTARDDGDDAADMAIIKQPKHPKKSKKHKKHRTQDTKRRDNDDKESCTNDLETTATRDDGDDTKMERQPSPRSEPQQQPTIAKIVDQNKRQLVLSDDPIKASEQQVTPSTVSSSSHTNKRSKRKRTETSSNSSSNNGKPLNGLILAISTLDVKGKQHSSTNSSYKEVSSACIALGASVTAQVHQRVFALICNESAVCNLTQRVRKAVKKDHAIIDVQWIHKCDELSSRVCHNKYLLNDMATKAIESKKDANLAATSRLELMEGEEGGDSPLIPDPDAGWSEPVSLDCCCVCHDTGRDCDWCLDCNVTLALKSKTLSV